MTKREAVRQNQQESTLLSLGFTVAETEALRRISMTLQRWYEKECGTGNGCIERDDETGTPYWFNANSRYLDPHDPRNRHRIADREKGALKRLTAIMGARNARMKPENGETRIDPLSTYIQTDPRGAALYIIRPGDVPEGADVQGYYSRGICVY